MPRLKRCRFPAIFHGLVRIGATVNEAAAILGCTPEEFQGWLDENPEQRAAFEKGRAEADVGARRLLLAHAQRPTAAGRKAALALLNMPDDDRIEPPPKETPAPRRLTAENLDRLTAQERDEFLRIWDKATGRPSSGDGASA